MTRSADRGIREQKCRQAGGGELGGSAGLHGVDHQGQEGCHTAQRNGGPGPLITARHGGRHRPPARPGADRACVQASDSRLLHHGEGLPVPAGRGRPLLGYACSPEADLMNGDGAHITLICNAAPKHTKVRLARKIARVIGHTIFRVIHNERLAGLGQSRFGNRCRHGANHQSQPSLPRHARRFRGNAIGNSRSPGRSRRSGSIAHHERIPRAAAGRSPVTRSPEADLMNGDSALTCNAAPKRVMIELT